MGLLWGVAFHWVDLVIIVAHVRRLRVRDTVGFHRYFTHRGFETRAPVKAMLAILGCMTMQGPLTQWVTDHRKHHALSDQRRATRTRRTSATATAPGARSRASCTRTSAGCSRTSAWSRAATTARDLYEDRLIRTIDRLYLVWVVLTLGIPFAIGYGLGGTGSAASRRCVWGGLVRVFLYQHATFSVNSICHMFGRQDYRSRDEARNNWLVALLVFGEGWHNNHHAFPASARHGLHRFQLDLSWWVIRGLERLGLVWNVRRCRRGAAGAPPDSARPAKRLELEPRRAAPRPARAAAARARPRRAQREPVHARRG